MRIHAPPGIANLTSNIEKTNSNVSHIIATTRDQVTHFGSIQDIGETLNAKILAHFPKARSIGTRFSPDIRNTFAVNNLNKLACYVISFNSNATTQATFIPNTFKIESSWEIPALTDSRSERSSISISTSERIVSSIHGSKAISIGDPRETSLGQVHPTLFVHQKAAESAAQLLGQRLEPDPIQMGKLVFNLADEQSPCKRLQDVRIGMENQSEKNNDSRGTATQTSGSMRLSRIQYEQSEHSMLDHGIREGQHRAYIALGSNIGDRIGTIESACQVMRDRGLKISRTSALYETKAMYLEDQQSFINGACEVC